MEELKDILLNSDFVYGGFLSLPIKISEKETSAYWIQNQQVFLNKIKAPDLIFVVFHKKHGEKPLLSWDKNVPVIVFGNYNKSNKLPEVSAVVNIVNSTTEEFYETLINDAFNFNDIDPSFNISFFDTLKLNPFLMGEDLPAIPRRPERRITY